MLKNKGKELVKWLIKNEDGGELLEYPIVQVAIVVGCVVLAIGIGATLVTLFGKIATSLGTL